MTAIASMTMDCWMPGMADMQREPEEKGANGDRAQRWVVITYLLVGSVVAKTSTDLCLRYALLASTMIRCLLVSDGQPQMILNPQD